MANTAQLTFRVEFHGAFWLVTDGTIYRTVRAGSELCDLLSGRVRLVANEPRPLGPRTETVEEYLARGGTIQRVRITSPDHTPTSSHVTETTSPRTKAQKPKLVQMDTEKLSLKDLGF